MGMQSQKNKFGIVQELGASRSPVDADRLLGIDESGLHPLADKKSQPREGGDGLKGEFSWNFTESHACLGIILGYIQRLVKWERHLSGNTIGYAGFFFEI
jgi:hypothetical protein